MNSSAARAVSLAVSGSKTIQPVSPLMKADVGEVVAAHLIDSARHDFIQPIGHVEHGLPLEEGWMLSKSLPVSSQP